jgi:NAD(P)-dependent dehydrogenase (short-subunit alcohol dehydrogenase family)/pimeloyl-ACP methyl ester carboxylesterase
MTAQTTPSVTTVAATDGVDLAVHSYTEIDPGRPTILAVHGYPDNHHVWDGVAEQLVVRYRDRYNMVAYDVRGAGDSSAPAARSGYRFARLVADVAAVIEHLGVDTVHLLGHDWGSIQGWAAVTDPEVATKIASYTSISGPQLDYAGRFLRSPRSPRAMFDVAKQVMESGYIWLFLTPRLPEVVFGSGLGRKVIDMLGRIGRSSTLTQRREVPRSGNDYRNGLNLYRANMPRPMLAPATQLPTTTVPAQVLVPRRDIFVSPALQRFTGAIPDGGRVLEVEGGHWVVTSRPDVIARLTFDWIERVSAGRNPAGATEVSRGRHDVCGKLALVTGAGAGIGRATAVELAQRGARGVVVTDRDLTGASDTAEAVRAAGAPAFVYQVDVTDQAAMEDLAARVNTKHGVVDILVNNAGIGMAGRFLETTPANWDAILGVNLLGVLNGTRPFAARMVERGQGGTIINVSSASAYLPSKSMVAYSTTKAAVLAFSEALRADLADEGITVTAVCPGFVNTNIANYTPEATAKAIVKAVETGPAVLPIAAESKIGYVMRRVSPSAIRALARVDLRRR